MSSVAVFLAASGRPDDLETVGRWAALCVLAGACCGVSAGLIRWASADGGRLLGAPAASGGVRFMAYIIVVFRAGAGLFGALLRVCSTEWTRDVANIRPCGGIWDTLCGGG